MKTKMVVIFVFVLFGIVPYAATAMPGIILTINPMSITAAGGTTISYLVTITNDDDCCSKTMRPLSITINQTGWTYTFNPDITGQIIPAGTGNNITTTLNVTVPASVANQLYNHQITAEADYDLFGNPGYDSMDAGFSTEVKGENTQIPEFPTIVLPIISALGIMLLMQRIKGRNQ